MSARRGLTLVELVIGLALTALVGGAIAGMLVAVNRGTGARADVRTAVVRAGAIAGRLSAYIAPARAIVELDANRLVVWLHDDRASDTVHATELRWIGFDPATSALIVEFVQFPADWTEVAKDLADVECSADDEFWRIRDAYRSRGHLESLVLAEALSGFVVVPTPSSVPQTRHVVCLLTLEGAHGEPLEIAVPATLRELAPPVR